MTITNSSTRLVAIAAAVAVALALMGAAAVAPAQAAGLTSTQISSIVSLLASFGADQATINNVTAALNGQATSGTGSNNPNTGSCPALSRDIKTGSTGADVKALQMFLNSNASTQVAASGAGSPGNETSTFGPATTKAVMKFQQAHGVSPVAGYVGAKTRAAIAATCGGTTGGTTGGTGTTGGAVSVSAGAQPVNSLAPKGSARVPFTTFTLSNNSSAPVTINSVTVQRAGLAQDAAFSGVVLLDSNGLQIGTAKTFNSNHQANVGDVGWTIPANSSQTFTVAGNMASSLTAYTGQVAAITVVAVNTGATVSGSLPITGASQTLNDSLTVGTVSTTTSSFDPGSTQTRNIGDVAVRFSGLKFTAGSTEDLKLYSVRWRQVGSGSSVDLANVMTNANGTNYPTTVDSSGKYYTTIFPGGLLITKGNSIDVYVQGDIVGSGASSRTIDFDIDKVTDVYFVGQLYGYGVAPSGTYTPWYNGYAVTVQGGTVTTISKANAGKAAAQNIAINVNNQPLGGFTTNFAGEAVSITGLTATVATSSASTGLLQTVSIVDENGSVVAGPVDATWVSGTQTLTFTDTVTFATGVHSYYFQGKVPSTANNGAGIAISTTPSSGWTNPTGQTTGNTVSLSGVGAITMNTMTVKGGSLSVSFDTTPSSQSVIAGASGFDFAHLVLDATQSGEDVRLASVPVNFTATGGAATLVTGCQMYDGSTALNSSSRVVNTLSPTAKTTFSFDNSLTVPKGTKKSLAIKCNLSSSATSTATFKFSNDTVTSDYSATGATSGVTITPTASASNAGTMTVNTASIAVTLHSSSPASTTASGGSTGQIVGVYNIHASNDAIQLTKVGLTLTSGAAADVSMVHLKVGATEIGTASFQSGQTVATSTLNGAGVTLAADSDTQIIAVADFNDVGLNKQGTEGDVIQVDANSVEGNGTSGLVTAGATGSTSGVRLYNSFPTFTYDTSAGSFTNGASNTLLTLNVAADAQGDIALRKLTFTIATTSITVTSPTFFGPNGNVASSTNVNLNPAGTTITVYFDSTTNTNDAVVGKGTSKTYTLAGVGNFVGTATTGSIATALKADTTASSTMKTVANISNGNNIVWSPMATTTSVDVNTNDWTNGYALTKGCFQTVGLGNDCTLRTVSK